MMAGMSRFPGFPVFVVVLMAVLSGGEARFGRGGGGGGNTSGGGSGGRLVSRSINPNLNPAEQLELAAKQAASTIVIWGTTTIFQLKQVAQLKGQVERLQNVPGGLSPDGKGVKMDQAMYKQVVQGALGGVFLMLNSPAMGKLSDDCRKLLKDGKRQAQLVALNNKVEQAYGGKVDGRNAPHKDPGGFLEGALLNKDLTTAHDKFMADVEALSNSGLAKKAASSAEAYHEEMLKYASSEYSMKSAAP